MIVRAHILSCYHACYHKFIHSIHVHWVPPTTSKNLNSLVQCISSNDDLMRPHYFAISWLVFRTLDTLVRSQCRFFCVPQVAGIS